MRAEMMMKAIDFYDVSPFQHHFSLLIHKEEERKMAF